MPNFGTTAKHGLRKLLGTSERHEIDDGIGALADDVDAIIATHDRGLAASRPASTPASPGKAGRFYNPTDARRLSLDTGTGWDEIPAAPASELTDGEGLWWNGTGWVSEKVTTARIEDAAITAAKIGTGVYGGVTFPSQTLNHNTARTLNGGTALSTVGMTVGADRLTVTRAGVYVVAAYQGHSIVAGDASRRIATLAQRNSGGAVVASTADQRVNTGNSGGVGGAQIPLSDVMFANVGDYFRLDAYQDSGGARSVDGHIRAVRIAGL